MPMREGSRVRLTRYGVDYDQIADAYDCNPVRRRGPDPDLLGFIAERGGANPLAILDIGCGTGIQLVADRSVAPSSVLVGLDPFIGMLRMARRKTTGIQWVQGDGMTLPFPNERFDFITNQFSYHHMDRPDRMIEEAYRVCRPGGRLVLSNMTPYAMRDSSLYEWFPETLASDLDAHPAPERLVQMAKTAGFVDVDMSVRTVGGAVRLARFAEKYAEKTGCSQLKKGCGTGGVRARRR